MRWDDAATDGAGVPVLAATLADGVEVTVVVTDGRAANRAVGEIGRVAVGAGVALAIAVGPGNGVLEGAWVARGAVATARALAALVTALVGGAVPATAIGGVAGLLVVGWGAATWAQPASMSEHNMRRAHSR